MGEENDKRRAARELMTEAAGRYADEFDGWEGALCTGYVAIFELTSANGRCVTWLTGDGGPPEGPQDGGLDSWRVEGLVRKVLRDIDAANVTRADE